jgi:hypothetical protein
MDQEKQKKQTSRSELTRKQKLARRFLPVALLAGGAVGVGVHEITKDNPENDAFFAKATVSVQTSEEFGGSDEGWGQGTAERAIKEAVEKGIERIDIKSTEFDNIDIPQVVEELPVLEQAAEVLETAGYNEVVPDPGDELNVEVAVTADSTGDVSYEVTNAKITDITNNNQ